MGLVNFGHDLEPSLRGSPYNDDEDAATQRSILEELHSIHDESQSDLHINIDGPVLLTDAEDPVKSSHSSNLPQVGGEDSTPAPLEDYDQCRLIVAAEEVGISDIIAQGHKDREEHDLLFDGLEDDTFDHIELSPPKQRTRALPHRLSLSSQSSVPASGLTTANDVSNVLAQSDSDDAFDPFYDPPDPAGQVGSFLNPQFVGFKTGRGQNVQLSEKGLDIAKRLFDDLDQDDDLSFASQLTKPVFVPPLKAVSSAIPTTLPKLEAQSPVRAPLREIPPRQATVAKSASENDGPTSQKPLPRASSSTVLPQLPQRPPPTVLPIPAFSSPLIRQKHSAVASFSPLRATPAMLAGTRDFIPRFSTPQSTSRIALTTSSRTDRPSTGRKRPLPRFVTPFKDGKRPKPEDVSHLQSPSRARIAPITLTRTQGIGLGRLHQPTEPVFDLKHPTERLKLTNMGRPEALTSLQMVAQGVPDEIVVILQDAAKASWYAFDTADGRLLRQEQALAELQSYGCHDATLSWVKNHWTMILWKLAAHARLNPREGSSRWSWQEVIRQLLYRYERETHLAHRSCIRRIQEHDSAPGRAMVLFVSQIHEDEEEVEVKTGGTILQKSVVVDLSDGWYRIQAQLDTVLAQACLRGRIKVGHKLAIMGARLENNGEGSDVMSAYHTSRIMLSANAVSLARWDARLGFARTSFVASLRSLTAEGGPIALMDIVILKVFPLAYIDAERGQNSAPRGVAEEHEAKEAWLQRRGDAQQRMEMQLESQNRRLEDLVECLASISGDTLLPVLPEDPTGRMEAEASRIFEQLCDHPNPQTAVNELVLQRGLMALVPWLRSMAKMAFATQAETGWTRMHADMDKLCPPRKVREFRVVRFRDARLLSSSATLNGNAETQSSGATNRPRDPHARTVQLTVWDAAQLGEVLREGQRFLVSNLVPTSKSAWRKADEPADIFLSTRRDTKWRPVAA